MQRLLNLLSNNNSKPPLSPNNKLKRPKWLSNRQNRLELPKRSKIKSTERMLNSLPCSKLRRRKKHLLKSLEKRLLWLKEQSKKNKIKPLLN
jgi:hypothetical protein